MPFLPPNQQHQSTGGTVLFIINEMKIRLDVKGGIRNVSYSTQCIDTAYCYTRSVIGVSVCLYARWSQP